MTERPPSQPVTKPERRSRKALWAVSLAFGLICGAAAGLGVVFLDGKDWIEGLATGLGFFAFGFLLFFFRFGRRLAELLSSVP